MNFSAKERDVIVASLEVSLERCKKAAALENAARPYTASTTDFGVLYIKSLIERFEERETYRPNARRAKTVVIQRGR
jgi:hypothetical protein